MKVLVTGGTGFIGSALIRHLLDAKYEVRVLARHKKNRTLLEGLDVEFIDGDIIYPKTVEEAVKGCDVIFDLASIYTFYPFWEKDAKALYKVNVQGTINMLNAALKYRVRRFIHTSTIATIGKNSNGKPSDENTGFNFRGASHYARSKYLAEQEVLKFCKKGLPAIILNPAIVIGERDYKPTPSGETIVKFLNRSYPGYFDTIWAVADVDDVARAHIAAIDHGRIGDRYILCNKSHYTLNDIFNLLEKISGVKAPRLKIPYPLLLTLVYFDEFLSYTVLKKKPIMPTEGVKFCKVSAIYTSAKAVAELGYISTPIEETLAKAVFWYRMNGYIEPRGILRFKVNGSKKINFIIKKLTLYRYTDKLSLGTLIFFSIVKFLQFLEKHGIKPSEDGWRKVTQTYLRTEHSKFILTAFRLDFCSNCQTRGNTALDLARKHIIARLSEFIRQQPALHWQLFWDRFSAIRQLKKTVDIIYANFDKQGNLENIEFYPDPVSDHESVNILSLESRNSIVKRIIKDYNKTKKINDIKRPLLLQKRLKKWALKQRFSINTAARQQVNAFIDRILSATFIHFEKLSEEASGINEKRYKAPTFIKAKHPGFGLLNILCRLTCDLKEADLWVQYSHIPVDGVQMQEILDDLKKQWGTFGRLKLPAPDYTKPLIPEPYSTKVGRKGVYHISQRIDFRPFLKLRNELNKQYVELAKGHITVVALFMWKLSHYPIFENIKFAIPVDLHATAKRERTLGFVFIRPSVYFDKYSADKGFLKFQQEFNRQLRAVFKRKSESYCLLESYALAPHFMYAATLKLLPSVIGEFVGTVGITIIKKADLFIGPSSDIHVDGFIAINNLLTPTEDGSRVCNVSIKGPKGKIIAYMNAINEVASSKPLS